MIVVHHLNNSRSQRILWLLEELGLEYEIVHHQRDSNTRLSPPSLKAVHPLGKSPVLVDGDRTIIESGAIIDYIIRRHGAGKLAPPIDSADYDQYQFWLHFGESSAILPLMVNLYVAALKDAAAVIRPRIEGEIDLNIGYIEDAVTGRDFLLGGSLTGADIQIAFLGEVLLAMGMGDRFPNIAAWVAKLQKRPAYLRAVEKGGPYNLAA